MRSSRPIRDTSTPCSATAPPRLRRSPTTSSCASGAPSASSPVATASDPMRQPTGTERATATPIDPAQLLLPGTDDATRLTWLWLVRRACTGLLFLGVVVGVVIEGVGNDAGDLHVDTGSA